MLTVAIACDVIFLFSFPYRKAQLPLQCFLYQELWALCWKWWLHHPQPALCVQSPSPPTSSPALPLHWRFLTPLHAQSSCSPGWIKCRPVSSRTLSCLSQQLPFPSVHKLPTVPTHPKVSSSKLALFIYEKLQGLSLAVCHVSNWYPKHHTPSCPSCHLLLTNCRKLHHEEKDLGEVNEIKNYLQVGLWAWLIPRSSWWP